MCEAWKAYINFTDYYRIKTSLTVANEQLMFCNRFMYGSLNYLMHSRINNAMRNPRCLGSLMYAYLHNQALHFIPFCNHISSTF